MCKILTNYNIYTSSTLKNTGTCNNKDGILGIFKYFPKVQDNCFIIAEKYFSRYLYIIKIQLDILVISMSLLVITHNYYYNSITIILYDICVANT